MTSYKDPVELFLPRHLFLFKVFRTISRRKKKKMEKVGSSLSQDSKIFILPSLAKVFGVSARKDFWIFLDVHTSEIIIRMAEMQLY